MRSQNLPGVYAAMPTPLKPDFSPAYEDLGSLLLFLAQRGCHGALIMGTTGEGPSFSQMDRVKVFQSALSIRETNPDFKLLAGTGTPSLDDTVQLTKTAFDLGYNGVVVLPPYYFKGVSDESLFAWYSHIILKAMPSDGAFLGYNIPSITGIPLSLNLLTLLKEKFAHKFSGVKDSSGDPEYARQLGENFGKDLLVFTGNDRLLSFALENKASGCITALANLYSPISRNIWDDHNEGKKNVEAQAKLDNARTILERYPPFSTSIKVLLSNQHAFPHWSVCPPMLPFPEEEVDNLVSEIESNV